MKFPVALQLFSVRDEASKDLRGTLAQVKQMGYDGVEFAGLHGHAAADIRQMLDEVGLVGISAHVAPAELMSDIQGKIDDYETIKEGVYSVITSYLIDEQEANLIEAKWKEVEEND
jgi:sugar phosphate isomerase/epimerase